MKLLKQLTLACALTLSFAAVMPVSAAVEKAGKIENASKDQIKAAAESALHHVEEALSGVKNGALPESVIEHLNEARQETKRIEVGSLDSLRNKASGKVTVAKAAIKKGDTAAAEAALVEAVKFYQDLKAGIAKGV